MAPMVWLLCPVNCEICIIRLTSLFSQTWQLSFVVKCFQWLQVCMLRPNICGVLFFSFINLSVAKVSFFWGWLLASVPFFFSKSSPSWIHLLIFSLFPEGVILTCLLLFGSAGILKVWTGLFASPFWSRIRIQDQIRISFRLQDGFMEQ